MSNLKAKLINNTAQIYLLYGDEKFFIQQAVKDVIELLIPEDDGFSVSYMEGKEATEEKIVSQAGTPPFFSDKRLIIVWNYPGLLSSGKEKSKDTEDDANAEPKGSTKAPKTGGRLTDFLKSPPTFSHIIFAVDGEVDKRKKLFSQLKTAASVHEFRKLKGRELMDWLVNSFKMNGKKIMPDAAEYMTSVVENDFTLLNSEIEKVCTYVGKQEQVKIKDLKDIVSVSTESDIFAMVDALSELKASHALRELEKLIVNGEPPIKILFMLTRQVRLLMQVKDFDGKDSFGNTNPLGLHPYVWQKTAKQGKNFSTDDLVRMLGMLAEYDRQTKTGKFDARHAIELFIINVCRKKMAR